MLFSSLFLGELLFDNSIKADAHFLSSPGAVAWPLIKERAKESPLEHLSVALANAFEK